MSSSGPGSGRREEILAEFDATMRRDPSVDPGERVERVGSIVRVVGTRAWIAYSGLSETEAPAAVRAEVERAHAEGIELEWKLFAHDSPRTLALLLEENGFAPDPPETLMVLDLRASPEFGPPARDLVVERVSDPAGLERACDVSRKAFPSGQGWDLDEYLLRLGTPTFEVFAARVGNETVSAGRLELPVGRAFASLWGGGTAPEFRGRGIYRALVAARVALARARGYRYVTVDALATSRPILERVGFQPLVGVVGWVRGPGDPLPSRDENRSGGPGPTRTGTSSS
ncbi:MAG: GNAT family N-acetyltransferase [Thermoplasmata archaeon]|nr:GNAT family N-acetyltransferase [Thermoplasmata archaeon]